MWMPGDYGCARNPLLSAIWNIGALYVTDSNEAIDIHTYIHTYILQIVSYLQIAVRTDKNACAHSVTEIDVQLDTYPSIFGYQYVHTYTIQSMYVRDRTCGCVRYRYRYRYRCFDRRVWTWLQDCGRGRLLAVNAILWKQCMYVWMYVLMYIKCV